MRLWTFKHVASAAAGLVFGGTCYWGSPAQSDANATDSMVLVGPYGIACKLSAKPGKLGPPNYRVSDLGKPGVPALTPDQLALVGRIQRYRGTDREQLGHLWFTFFGKQLVVFDASEYPQSVEPCVDFPLGYEVLSDPNPTFYEPGESDSLTPYMCADAKPWLIPTPPPEYQKCP